MKSRWVDLDTLRAGRWRHYKPRPAKISAIAFGALFQLGPAQVRGNNTIIAQHRVGIALGKLFTIIEHVNAIG